MDEGYQGLVLEIHDLAKTNHEYMIEIKESIARIEVDLKHHIKRTDTLEDLVGLMRNKSYKVEGALIALGSLGTVMGIISALKAWFNV